MAEEKRRGKGVESAAEVGAREAQAREAAQAQAKATTLTAAQQNILDKMAMGGSSLEEQIAMRKRFLLNNMLNDPESDIYKWVLQGTLKDAQSMMKRRRQAAPNPAEVADGGLGALSEEDIARAKEEALAAEIEQEEADWAKQQRQSARTREWVNQAIGAYKMHPALLAGNIVGQVVGNAAQMLGNMSAAKYNGLANALLADKGSTASDAQKQLYGDPYGGKLFSAAKAYGYDARGKRHQEIGNAINRTIQGILGTLNMEHQQQRMLRNLMENRPSGEYFRQEGRVENRLAKSLLAGR